MNTVRPLGWWWAITLVATAGFTLRLAFPAPSIWIAAPLGVVCWLAALQGRGFWSGFLLSLIGGLSFWLTLIHWLTLYLGPLPWAALAALMALYVAVAGGVIAWLMRWLPHFWPGKIASYIGLPALIASVWVAREWLAMNWPYGGFSWGRIAMSQTEGPFAPLLSWFGATGVSWLVVALSAALYQLLRNHERRAFSGQAFTFGIVLAALLAVPVWPTTTNGELRVLAVQGGADASLFTDLPAGSVLKAQANATLEFADEDVDVVVWPENGADIDPLRSGASAAVLSALSERFDAPFVVGAITLRDEQYFNSSLLWRAPEGLVEIYDKAHPVPFAEYMPDRAFWRPFAPDLIDLISRDYTAGTRSNVFDLGTARAGIAICFDIAYDDLIDQMVDGGAQVIFAQTNNADFGHTDESVQQLAIARMRALETGRSVVNISTVGSSAIIAPNGQTMNSLPTWTPGGMVETLPLAASTTPATLLSAPLSTLAIGFAVLGCLLTVLLRVQAAWSSPRRARNHSKRS